MSVSETLHNPARPQPKAMLELIKRYHISAVQNELFGEIEFEKMGDWKDDEEIEIEFE